MRRKLLVFITAVLAVYTQSVVGASDKPLPTPPPPLTIGQPCKTDVYLLNPNTKLTRQVSKEVMTEFLSSPDAVLIRGVPSFSKDKVVGLKILSIKPGSFYEAIGLERADTLLMLNGKSPNAKQSFFEVFSDLAKKSRGTIKVLRECKPILIQIN